MHVAAHGRQQIAGSGHGHDRDHGHRNGAGSDLVRRPGHGVAIVSDRVRRRGHGVATGPGHDRHRAEHGGVRLREDGDRRPGAETIETLAVQDVPVT